MTSTRGSGRAGGGSGTDDVASMGRRIGRSGVRPDIARVTSLRELTGPGRAQQVKQTLPV